VEYAQAIGRSRGGLSTKNRATVDAEGYPTGFHLTPGQASDLHGADVLLADTPADGAIGDKAYDADERVIDPLLAKDKKVVIPPKANRREPRDYDKTARNFRGAVHLATVLAWLV
jgi:IS5 family transposase